MQALSTSARLLSANPQKRNVMSSPIRNLPRGMILLLAAASALGPVAMQILLPAVPVLREHFNVGAGMAQLTLSLSMLSIAFSTLFYGPLSDRFGRRPVLLGGIAVALVGSLLCVLAPSIELLIAGRVIQAAGGSVGLVVARAIIRDTHDAVDSTRLISTLVMVMVVMPMLSPAVGGELMVRFDWHSVFYLVAGMSLFLLLALGIRLPETLKEPVMFTGILDMLRGFVLLLRSRAFRGYTLTLAFVSVMFFSFISAAPEIMVTVLDRPATEYGYYYMLIPAGFILGNYMTRHLLPRIGAHRMIDVGSVISVSGILIAITLQLLGQQHPITLFLPITLTTFGNGLSLPSAQAAAINEFPEMAGSASGLTGFVQWLFSAAAAQIVALIFNGTVYPMLVMMLLAGILSLLSFRLNVTRTAD